MATLDDIDIKILRELQQDGKMTTKELAGKVHLTSSPTFERQKRLEREGYIERYRAIVNPQKTGLGLIVFCNVALKQHTRGYENDFMQAVKTLPEVVECYSTSGDYDFVMKVYVRNHEEYHNFLQRRLSAIEYIDRVQSNFVRREAKEFTGIPVAKAL